MKLTFSSPVTIAEFPKFADILFLKLFVIVVDTEDRTVDLEVKVPILFELIS